MKKIKALAFMIAVLLCASVFLAACDSFGLSGIEITKNPDKLDYAVGESFDKTGMEVTAIYAGNKSEVLADNKYSVSPAGPLTAGDKKITVSFGGKSVELAILVGPTKYSEETEGKLAEFIEDIFDSVLTGDAPDWWLTLKDGAAERIVSALKQAQFTDDMVNSLMASIESYYGVDFYDSLEDPNFLLGLADDFYEAGISNGKYAKFVWAVVTEFRNMADDLLADMIDEEYISEEIAAELISFYDELLGLGKDDFILIFKTLLDISKLSFNNSDALIIAIPEGEEPTLNEFKDIILSLKEDALSVLDILNADAISAFCNIFKLATPFAATSFDDDYYLNRLAWYEDDIEWYEDYIREYEDYLADYEISLQSWTDLLAQNPGNQYYESEIEWNNQMIANYEQSIAYYEQCIAECEDRIEFYESMIGEGNKDKAIGYMNDLIDNFAGDYVKLTVSLRASLNAINDAMITAVYNAIDSENIDTLAIAAGKIIHAGLTAQGGLNEGVSKELLTKYLSIFFDISCLLNPLEDEDYEQNEDFAIDIIERICKDAAALNAVSNYSAKLGASFDENIIVQLIRGDYNGGIREPSISIDEQHAA